MTPHDRLRQRDRVPAIIVRGADGDLRVMNERGRLLGTIAQADSEPQDDGLGAMRGICAALSITALVVVAFVLLYHVGAAIARA